MSEDFNAGVRAAIAEYELCCELGIDYDAVAPRMRDLLRPEASAPEPVAWQQLKDGKWIECSEFVAKGWDGTIDPECRPLYAAPPTSACTATKRGTP